VSHEVSGAGERRLTNVFERYLTLWIGLCIVGGILLGRVAPGFAKALDGVAIRVNGAPAAGDDAVKPHP